jgi:hypothetical protein
MRAEVAHILFREDSTSFSKMKEKILAIRAAGRSFHFPRDAWKTNFRNLRAPQKEPAQSNGKMFARLCAIFAITCHRTVLRAQP